jgi:hypothetical protein
MRIGVALYSHSETWFRLARATLVCNMPSSEELIHSHHGDGNIMDLSAIRESVHSVVTAVNLERISRATYLCQPMEAVTLANISNSATSRVARSIDVLYITICMCEF